MSDNLYIDLRKVNDGELYRLFHHYHYAAYLSAESLLEAIRAHTRREPLPTPIWCLREAHQNNLNNLETILLEWDRRTQI